MSREKYCQVVLFFVALMLYSTTGYMYFELPENPDLQWVDSLWWSIVTMTTVGYGDLFPISKLGRILVGFPTMLLGVGILGYLLSLVATTILKSRIMEVKGMNEITLSGHIIICNFVSLEKVLKLIQEIERDNSTKDDHIVFVDNTIEELPAEFQAEKFHFVKGDPARETVLNKANLVGSKAVIIQANVNDQASSDDHNLRIGLTIESLSPSTRTVVECINPENEIFFRRANCDSVVCIAGLVGQMMIQELQDPGVGTIVSELTSNAHGKQFYVIDIGESTNDYKSVQQKYNGQDMILLGIRRGEKNFIMPDPDFNIHEGDRAILISSGRPLQ
jgi:voltage-gated potassium channel